MNSIIIMSVTGQTEYTHGGAEDQGGEVVVLIDLIQMKGLVGQ